MSYKLAFSYPDSIYAGIDPKLQEERFPFMIQDENYLPYTRINGLPLKAFKVGDDSNEEPCYVFGTLDRSIATYITMNLRRKRAYPWLTKDYNKFYYLAQDKILRNIFKEIDVHFLTGFSATPGVLVTNYRVYYNYGYDYDYQTDYGECYVRPDYNKTSMRIENVSSDFIQLELRTYGQIVLYSDYECTNLIARVNQDEDSRLSRLIFALAPQQSVYTFRPLYTLREG